MADVIDIHEAATLLKVSEKTIRRHLPQLPHRRLGKKILFSQEAIVSYVRGEPANRQKATHPKADF